MKRTTAITEILSSQTKCALGEVEEGFERRAVIARKMGWSDSYTRENLRRLIDEGKVEMKKFKVIVNKSAVWAPHYGPASK